MEAANSYCQQIRVVWIAILFTSVITAKSIQVTVTTVPVGNIIKYVNQDLNLTCRVNSSSVILTSSIDRSTLTSILRPSSAENNIYKITWSLPLKSSKEKARVSIFPDQNELTVTIHHLQKGDSGLYTCEVNGNDIQMRRVVNVTVKSEKQFCGETMFACSRGTNCIPKRFVCDGYVDCEGAVDEDVTLCGPDPCKGKFQCDDGRCMSPDLCCDPTANPDCSIMYLVPCCHRLLSIGVKTSSGAAAGPQQSHQGDINFIQSTIYTIVSCAIAFIFITLIMIIAICRIHMKRSAMSINPNQPYLHRPRPSIGGVSLSRRLFYWPWRHLGNRDTRSQHSPSSQWSNGDGPVSGSNESLCQPQPSQDNHHHQGGQLPRPYPCTISSTGSFVVMYRTANGVQLIERLPKPPPYTEMATTHLICPSSSAVLTGHSTHNVNTRLGPPLMTLGSTSTVAANTSSSTSWGPPPAYRSVENIGCHGSIGTTNGGRQSGDEEDLVTDHDEELTNSLDRVRRHGRVGRGTVSASRVNRASRANTSTGSLSPGRSRAAQRLGL